MYQHEQYDTAREKVRPTVAVLQQLRKVPPPAGNAATCKVWMARVMAMAQKRYGLS